MQILVIGPAWIAGSTVSVARALTDLGCSTDCLLTRFDLAWCRQAGRLLYPAAARLGRRLLEHHNHHLIVRQLQQRSYDGVFLVHGSFVHAETVQMIRKRHRGWMAIWLMDDPLIIWKSRPQLHQLLTTYSIFDMVAVFDSYFIDGLRSHGIADCVHLPLAYDNAVFRPETAEERYAVSFVGENSPHREGVLTGLAGVPLHVWGGTFAVAGSRICHPRITPGEACAVYQSTAVCLNISDPQSIRGNNTRVYEVCGSGGFLLTDYRSELAEQFRIGAEIEVYSSRDELREKVMYFLDHPATRRQIAAAGAARAARDHTYCCRMTDLLAHLTGGRTLLTSR